MCKRGSILIAVKTFKEGTLKISPFVSKSDFKVVRLRDFVLIISLSGGFAFLFGQPHLFLSQSAFKKCSEDFILISIFFIVFD